MNGLTFDLDGQAIPVEDVLYALEMMESSGGENIKPRYEEKFHKGMIKNYRSKNWIPTPTEKRMIDKYGFDKATEMFSTSYGSYQTLPETIYRYTSFTGEPTELENKETQLKYVNELLQKFHKQEGGDLKEVIYRWNQGEEFFPKFKEFLKSDKLTVGKRFFGKKEGQ